MFLRRQNWLLVAAMLLLCACGHQAVQAPVDDRTGYAPPPRTPPPAAVSIPLQSSGANNTYHVVVPGDTLRSIAYQYRQDFQQVAQWNRISSPYRIRVGDRIRVRPYPEELATPVTPSTSQESLRPGSTTRPPLVVQDVVQDAAPAVQDIPPAFEDTAPMIEPDQAPAPGPVHWQWPAEGPLLKQPDGSFQGVQGIDISGSYGQSVRAAADGKVVYTGSGLVGYGQLIILKHSNNFLSAYAHNHSVLVKEGDRVSVGQIIAEMGSSGTDRPMLHFEIRQDGKPVDPIQYLPKR